MLIKTIQLLLSLSILVFIHELGHFLAARLFKTRVEKFYLFFDFLFPVPTLLNFALFKKKIGDTEYGLGWFPLGGYVKIAGMIDESMDESFLETEPQPWEYRSKKNWQKLIIMLGGIIMNVLLAWIIYSQMAYWQGDAYLPAENAKYGISCDSVAMYAGFRDGDIILSHDGGTKFESLNTVAKEIIMDGIKTVEVNRNGTPVTITIPSDFVGVAIASKSKSFIDFRIPCMVGEFTEESAIKGKLKRGDLIVAINDSAVNYFQEAKGIVAPYIGKDVVVKFVRGADTLTATVKIPASGLLGFKSATDMHDYKGRLDIVETNYSLPASFVQGGKVAFHRVKDYLKQMGLMFKPEVKAYKHMGGIGTIGSLFPASWDWVAFWQLTAFISIMLAVANLLPIPMLDGGYVIILLFEMVTRRKVSDKALEYINQVGFFIVIALIVLSNGMDIYRAFFGK